MIRYLRFVVFRIAPLLLGMWFVHTQSRLLGDQVSRITGFLRVWEQRTQMMQVVPSLRSYIRKLRRPPPNLKRYLDGEFDTKKDMSMDTWGSPLQFRQEGRIWYLLSCGPDRQCSKSWDKSPGDDIVLRITELL